MRANDGARNAEDGPKVRDVDGVGGVSEGISLTTQATSDLSDVRLESVRAKTTTSRTRVEGASVRELVPLGDGSDSRSRTERDAKG